MVFFKTENILKLYFLKNTLTPCTFVDSSVKITAKFTLVVHLDF